MNDNINEYGKDYRIKHEEEPFLSGSILLARIIEPESDEEYRDEENRSVDEDINGIPHYLNVAKLIKEGEEMLVEFEKLREHRKWG